MKTRLLRTALLTICAVYLVATVASFCPPFHWSIALLPHFRVQYVWCALILAVCVAPLHRKNWCSVLLVAAAVHLSAVLPYFGSSKKSVEFTTPPDLRILLWNTWHRSENLTEIIALVGRETPDIAVLQEVTPELTASVRDFYSEAYETRTAGDNLFLIRRSPSLELASFIELQIGTVTGGQLQLAVGGKPLTLLGIHLSAPVSRRMIRARRTQFNELEDWIMDQGDPLVLVGDLNSAPWAPEFSQLNEVLENSMVGFGIQPTWPYYNAVSPVLGIPIDHALHSHEITTQWRSVGDPSGSNHRPLVFGFAVNPR